MKRALVLVVLAACSRMTPPHASSADAERAHVQLADLEEGRTLLVRKCGSCHQPPLPVQHAKLDWPKMLDEMSSRTNLDARQRGLILQYLVVMNEATTAPGR